MRPRRKRRPPSLTSTTVTEIFRLRLDERMSIRQIAAKVGVSKSMVGRLVVRLDRPADPSKKSSDDAIRRLRSGANSEASRQ